MLRFPGLFDVINATSTTELLHLTEVTFYHSDSSEIQLVLFVCKICCRNLVGDSDVSCIVSSYTTLASFL